MKNKMIYDLIESNDIKSYYINKNIEMGDTDKVFIIINSEKIDMSMKIKLLKQIDCFEYKDLTDKYEKIIKNFNNETDAVYEIKGYEDDDTFRTYDKLGVYKNLEEIRKVVSSKYKKYEIKKMFLNKNKSIKMYINSNFDYIKVDTHNISKYPVFKTSCKKTPFKKGDIIGKSLSYENNTIFPYVISNINEKKIEVVYLDYTSHNLSLNYIEIKDIYNYKLINNITDNVLSISPLILQLKEFVLYNIDLENLENSYKNYSFYLNSEY